MIVSAMITLSIDPEAVAKARGWTLKETPANVQREMIEALTSHVKTTTTPITSFSIADAL